VRRKTIAEAIRVTRPGGKLIFVDYHAPKKTNPLRYLMRPVLHFLEPFALDLWHTGLPDYLPDHIGPQQVRSQFYCGGLYQKVVVTC
jgi:ubiquinone/menaquinone biosynthesis C-methylase UbiE